MVKVHEELPRTAQGEVSLELWAQRVCAEHDHLDSSQLVDVAQGLHDRIPSVVNPGLELAELVADLNMDQAAVHAALLYRAVRGRHFDGQAVEDLVGTDAKEVCMAVASMATSSLLEMSNSPLLEKEHGDQVENVKRMLIALIDDVRVAVVKLAERLLALRRAKNYAPERRARVAQEALTVFAPLAGRLGIWQLKWELEDLALRYTQPGVYQDIAAQLQGKRAERERQVEQIVDQVRGLLRAHGIQAMVYGRAKNIFSIWRKMQKKDVPFDQLHDVRAVRVVVDNLAQCYAALGVLHSVWQHIPNEFDDYVAKPKENGYRSIHTAVIATDDKFLEIQIRTVEMHEDAELGVCAHWSYKDGVAEDQSYSEKMDWLRQVIEWHEDLGGTESLGALLSHRVSDERIYVSTPKGHVLDLPVDATVLDFAYRVHTDVGQRCRGAKVNGVDVPLNQRLETGQQVEVTTAPDAVPSRDWLESSLGFLSTDRARAKVVKYFRSAPVSVRREVGRECFCAKLAAIGFEAPSEEHLQTFAAQFELPSVEDLWVYLGGADISVLTALELWLDGYADQRQLLLPGLPPAHFPLQARFKIVGDNRDGLLRDITEVIGRMDLPLTGTTGRVSIGSSRAIITVDVTLPDWNQTICFVSRVPLVDGVYSVQRMGEKQKTDENNNE